MFVNNIKVRNFRNHHLFECNLQRRAYIYGDNGSGKTSIAEGIYLALNLRTFKKQPLKDIISFGESSLRVAVSVKSSTPDHGSCLSNEYVLFYQGVMTVKNNGEKIESSVQHLYDNPVVYYSPNTDSVLSGEQSVKRKQLDKIVFHTDKNYATQLNHYNRLIMQKRSLLSKISTDNGGGNGGSVAPSHQDRLHLETLNSQILPAAKIIYTKRQEAVCSINQHLETLYDTLDQTHPHLYDRIYLSHSSSVNTSDPAEVLKREEQEGVPLYGTHRDRINIRKDGKLFEKFSSFGQGKSFHILLLYSIRHLIAQRRGIVPLTLLDDFEAGLDSRRVGSLLEVFDTGGGLASHANDLHGDTDRGQIIITGVNPLTQAPSRGSSGVAIINLNDKHASNVRVGADANADHADHADHADANADHADANADRVETSHVGETGAEKA